MASAHSDGPGSICLVANDLDHIVRNSGIGTYFSLMAPLLAKAGWRVHILYLGFVDDPRGLAEAPAKLRSQGVSLSLLSDFETPEMMRVRRVHGLHGEFHAGIGIRILKALEELHRVHHFDLIEFPDWLAFGFRTVQARRTGRCLGSARLCVKLHGTSSWQREGNHCWAEGPSDLSLDFRERYAFEHADVQMSPSHYMVDYVTRHGWNVGEPVIAYPFPEPVVTAPRIDGQAPNEIVFFGRLEIRKGLEVFLDAVSDLPPGIKLTFLGKDTVLPSGYLASGYIGYRLQGRNLEIRTDLMREQALNYLAGGNRLSVIASFSETFGFTLAECAVNGLPFIAAQAGGTAEVIPDPVVQEGLFFQPNSRDLRRCLDDYLKMSPDRRRSLLLRAQEAADPKVRNRQVTGAYDGILSRYRQESMASVRLSMSLSASIADDSTQSPQQLGADSDDVEVALANGAETRSTTPGDDEFRPATFVMPGPLVTVGIAHYNLGLYLPATLEAIASQTYPHIEVIVVDDGSTCPVSVRVLNDMQQAYPRFRFLSQKNSGPGVARNRALHEAQGEFFVAVDADNVPVPTMVERFVEGMSSNPDLAALTCFVKGFRHEEGTDAEVSEFVYMPTGGPFALACFENVYGDTNAIFRTQEFRDAGGFETDPNTFIEDWETFVKLVASGLKLDVVPEALVHYRLRGDNRSLTMSRDYTDTFPFVQRMIKRRFVPHRELSNWDADMLWLGMASFGNRKPLPPLTTTTPLDEAKTLPLRYRVADKLNSYLRWISPFHRLCRSIAARAVSASVHDPAPARTASEGPAVTTPPGETPSPRPVRRRGFRSLRVRKAA